ncbi:hypothetical protein C8J56DRAFT_892603 [Mycena floridula]|nr:hypothetical protein C8J56DRAFT_892603 [Mycena floridula]
MSESLDLTYCETFCETFANKRGQGPCGKCDKIVKNKEDSRRKDIQDLPQCLSCGACSKWMDDPCKVCQAHNEVSYQDRGLPPQQSGLLDIQQLQQLSHKNNAGWLNIQDGGRHVPKNDATLGGLRLNNLTANNLGAGAEMITVIVDSFVDLKPAAMLGNFERAMPSQMTVENLATAVLKTLNVVWDESCEVSLSIDTVFICKIGNKVIEIPWAATLATFYCDLIGSTMDPKSLFAPKYKTHKFRGEVLYLEMHIRMELFAKTPTIVDSMLKSKTTGKRHQMEDAQSGSGSKRALLAVLWFPILHPVLTQWDLLYNPWWPHASWLIPAFFSAGPQWQLMLKVAK